MQLPNLEFGQSNGVYASCFQRGGHNGAKQQEIFRPHWQEVTKLTMVSVELSKVNDGPAKRMHYGGI